MSCASFNVTDKELATLKRGRVTIRKIIHDVELGEVVELRTRGEVVEGRVVELDGPYMFHFITLEEVSEC